MFNYILKVSDSFYNETVVEITISTEVYIWGMEDDNDPLRILADVLCEYRGIFYYDNGQYHNTEYIPIDQMRIEITDLYYPNIDHELNKEPYDLEILDRAIVKHLIDYPNS